MRPFFIRKAAALAMVMCALAMGAKERGFAIIVDSLSHDRVAAELDAYAASVERQGLVPEIVAVGEDVTPDSIRSIIRGMAVRRKAPIEGFVLVGDIPIPMLLDAQHLTSAFKAAQSPKRLERGSVPSDRFYDDLNLKFDFVKRDEKKPLLYYYSLRYDSPQKVKPSLYSGRIKSMDFYGKDKYENLRDYLRKLVRVRERGEKLNSMLFFAGSGYNSESMIARMDERVALLEQFPRMKGQSGVIKFLDHEHSLNAKFPLMSQLQQPDLSLALLHHHGSPVKEYINRYPDARGVRTQLDQAKFFFRGKIRNAVADGEPLDSAVARYCRDYDVPSGWFDNVMDSALIAADSIYNERMDLHIYEFGKYRPNVRMVMLDACFNGSFNNDEYIAGAYIFGEGDCVAAIANSVNSLQDKWCDKYIGLLDRGMRIGNLVKYNPYLEMHVIGDPAFAFASSCRDDVDINDAIAGEDCKYWRRQLDTDCAPMQAMALEQLYNAGAIDAAGLIDCFKTSRSYLVRLSALMLLSRSGGDEFVEAIGLGLDDEYELIRRFSAVFAGKNGSPALIPALVRAYTDDLIGERVDFQVKNALVQFDGTSLLAELDRQKPFRYSYDGNELAAKAAKDIGRRYSDNTYDADLAQLKSDKPDKAEIASFLRQLRNHPLHTAVDELFDYFNRCDNDEDRYKIVEAFGWFDYSYRASEIASRLDKVAVDSHFPEKIRNEARKSVNRLLGR